MNLLKLGLVASVACAVFVACSDDDDDFFFAEVGENSVEPEDEIHMVRTYERLPECSFNREGVEYYVKSEMKSYTCDGEEWVSGDGKLASSSSMHSSSSYDDFFDRLSSVATDSILPIQHLLDSIAALYASSSSWMTIPMLSSSSSIPAMYSSSLPTFLFSSSSGMVASSSSSYITPPTYYGKSYFRWNGPAGEYWVDTGLDNGTETSGYWFPFDDHVDGGLSTIIWPVALGNEYSEDALDPVIDACGGVCGTFELDIGSLVYKPFVGVAFNVAGTKSALGDPLKDADVADASAWRGICITYTSDVPPVLELSMGEKKDSALVAYDIPFASLPRSTTANEVCKSWAQFKQAGWGTGKISGDSIATTLATIRFKIQAADSTTGSFNIISVSSYY